MTTPRLSWRSYRTDPLPAPAEALPEPFRAFPSWFLRIECDRCGKVRMVNESHAKRRDRTLRDVLHRSGERCFAGSDPCASLRVLHN